MDINDILEIIGRINQDIYEIVGDEAEDGMFDLHVEANNWFTTVLILGWQIWSSEDDDRPFVDEHEEEQQDIEEYLRKKIVKIMDISGKLNQLNEVA